MKLKALTYNVIFKTGIRDEWLFFFFFFAAMQPLSMKLINYQKQVVRERGTEGQRVILVDKRRRLDRSNDLTAENILTSS